MEERKYTFYDRYQKVRYESVTAEELEVLNASYNKEHYMFHQQHKRNNTLLFCGMQTETSSAEDFLTDMSFDVAGDVANELFFKELFSDLTEKENCERLFYYGKETQGDSRGTGNKLPSGEQG